VEMKAAEKPTMAVVATMAVAVEVVVQLLQPPLMPAFSAVRDLISHFHGMTILTMKMASVYCLMAQKLAQ